MTRIAMNHRPAGTDHIAPRDTRRTRTVSNVENGARS